MSTTFKTAATFPILEHHLLEDLKATAVKHPLAPRWVVVPSATLVNHLRVRLAQAAGERPLANVRVVSLPRFAEQLCTTVTGHTMPAWDTALDLMLFELVARLPARSPLARLNKISGGAALLQAAFTDLAEAGFGPGDLWSRNAVDRGRRSRSRRCPSNSQKPMPISWQPRYGPKPARIPPCFCTGSMTGSMSISAGSLRWPSGCR